MLVMKIIVSVITLAVVVVGVLSLIDDSPYGFVDFYDNLGVNLIVFGIAGIVLSLGLWLKIRAMLFISIILFIILVAAEIIIAIGNKKEKEKRKDEASKKTFTKNVIEEFPKEMISMAYYFVDKSLKLTKVTEGTEEQTKSGKIIVSTNILNNIIEIPNDIPGKLLEINKDSVKIQFGSDVDKSLVFEITEKNEFKLKTKDKLMVSYDKSEYEADKEPIILFKFQKNISEKTVSRKETGAW